MPSCSTKPRQARSEAAGPGPDRRRSCGFCRQKLGDVDFRDVLALCRVTADKGKIRSRRITGTCRRHQNQVGVAVKRAREMSLLPSVNS